MTPSEAALRLAHGSDFDNVQRADAIDVALQRVWEAGRDAGCQWDPNRERFPPDYPGADAVLGERVGGG